MCVVQINMIKWRKLEQIKTTEKTGAKTVRYLSYVFPVQRCTVCIHVAIFTAFMKQIVCGNRCVFYIFFINIL